MEDIQHARPRAIQEDAQRCGRQEEQDEYEDEVPSFCQLEDTVTSQACRYTERKGFPGVKTEVCHGSTKTKRATALKGSAWTLVSHLLLERRDTSQAKMKAIINIGQS